VDDRNVRRQDGMRKSECDDGARAWGLLKPPNRRKRQTRKVKRNVSCFKAKLENNAGRQDTSLYSPTRVRPRPLLEWREDVSHFSTG